MTGSAGSSRARSLVGWDPYRILLLSAIALLITGTVVYRVIEDWSLVDSLYFSVVAATTVGFGDLTPTTDGSKLFTVAYILASVGVISTFLHQRLEHRGGRLFGNPGGE